MKVLRILRGEGRSLVLVCLFILLGAGWQQALSAAPGQVRLRGQVPQRTVIHARAVGRVARTETISLALALPLRHQAALTDFLGRLYDPADPLYRHYLTPAEFTSLYGPTQQSYNAVIVFARSHGLQVTRAYPNRLLLDVSGPAAAVESAFSVRLMRYRNADGRIFHAPDVAPAIPASLVGRLSGVIGLSNNVVLRPHSHRLPPSRRPRLKAALQPAEIGTGPTGGLSPTDIKAAYNLDQSTLTGTGRTLALYELDGYDPSDIAAYEKQFSLPSVPLQNIPLSSGAGGNVDSTGEVTLDIELMIALAPGASKILVYEGVNGSADIIDIYNQMANDNIAKEISTSWGSPEQQVGQSDLDTENTIFQQMAAQGQSLYSAAGDFGAYDDGTTLSVDDPASQPYVTGVGGTKLAVTKPGGSYLSESTYGDPTDNSADNPHGSGGGGGISAEWLIPSYQIGFGQSTTQRNVPDVALESDPTTGYAIYYQGGWGIVGGTSCAAPLWAAFTALVNQQRTVYSEADLGFANPSLYQYGTGTDYASGFHDIADGSTNLFYKATTGYDNATGLGSFNGAGLLALLAPAPVVTTNPLASVTFASNPIVGGLTTTGTVTLTNPATSDTVVTLSASDTTLATVPTSVTVPSGSSTADFTVTTSAVTTSTPVTITATLGTDSQSGTLTLSPPPATITPQTLTFEPASVCGGDSTTATVTLTGPAPASGFSIALFSGSSLATVPASVTIPAGQASATFTVLTSQPTVLTNVTLSATLNGSTLQAKLAVLAPTLLPPTLDQGLIRGGHSDTMTISLTCPAPVGGATVALSSDTPQVIVPASVTLPAGATSATVVVTTQAVAATTKATITAVYSGLTQTTTLSVSSGILVTVALAPTTVNGSASSIGTVSVDSPAPAAGLVITLASSNAAAQVPTSVTIPSGATSVNFTVTTASVTAPVVATISATLNGVTESATLTIQPIQVIALTLSTASAIIGTSVTGTLTLSAPAPAAGQVVTLASSAAAATVPATFTVAAGQTTATFTVTLVQPGSVTISATAGGQTQTAPLTIVAAAGTSFPAGLNLLSVPYNYSGQSLDTLFGYTGVRLAVWLPAANQYALTPAAPANSLVPGRGYWVNLPHAVILPRTGTPVSTFQDFSISLATGWNQIGDPFTTPVRLSNVRVSSGTGTIPFTQSVTDPTLLLSELVYRYSPDPSGGIGSYIWVRSDDTLQPGTGYWIYAYQPVTLIIPHAGG